MRPKSALLTILLAAILATMVIGIGTSVTSAKDTTPKSAMRSL